MGVVFISGVSGVDYMVTVVAVVVMAETFGGGSGDDGAVSNDRGRGCGDVYGTRVYGGSSGCGDGSRSDGCVDGRERGGGNGLGGMLLCAALSSSSSGVAWCGGSSSGSVRTAVGNPARWPSSPQPWHSVHVSVWGSHAARPSFPFFSSDLSWQYLPQTLKLPLSTILSRCRPTA